jgi:medium-chain acyl-[acyl-carrier-protein] hydrolase
MTISSACDADPLWFEHLSRTKTPTLRVFCMPYAGGSADIYRGWQRWFPEQIDICLVHLPGRGTRVREEPFTQLTPLVKAIAAHIGGETKIPYALYGHSMGALISFELGRELFGRHRNSPAHVFVSGCRAPQWPKTEPPTFNLPHDKFIHELKRLNGTPREVLDDRELMEVFLKILRADFEIVDTYEYHPKERLSCPITVYGGLQDEDVSVESCRAWQEQTSANCKVHMFEGDHFFMRDPQSEFGWAFRNDIMRAFAVLRPQEI